jgi:cellulose synthase/poly-beta-1,6-N-acetylglucosamine synthase-like glycosyltransferase
VAWLFWICLAAIVYPYLIYPALLVAFNRLSGRRPHAATPGYLPSVTILMPVHNEAQRVPAKIANLLALQYPAEKIQIIAIADGCKDDSAARARDAGGHRLEVIELPTWSGKAAALNAGLERARGDIVVFTDVGIMLEPGSLAALTGHFADPAIGCVSGEDYIAGADSEGLYGRIELLLRREEAKLHSIAGASGCFYGQRRELCKPFIAGMAPDFLSVLVTVRAGKRALAEPSARGSMTSTSSQKAEFTRKTRTFLRGITALAGNAALLNPFAYPGFSFILWSHKAMRWLAPIAMVLCLVGSWMLRADPFYAIAFWAQIAAYSAAAAATFWPAQFARISVARLAGFFLLVNLAALKALWQWLTGVRVEIWEPTRRP